MLQKRKNSISALVITVFFVATSVVVFSAQPQKAFAITCSCVPNKEVYPNGNDPHCVNGVYNGPDTSYCGGTTSNSLSPISCSFSNVRSFRDLVLNIAIGCMIQPSYRVIIGLTVIIFLWGVFKFMRAEGDEDRQSGKKFIIGGLIGLFVMLSISGLIQVLIGPNSLNLNNSYDITPRQVTIPGVGL